MIDIHCHILPGVDDGSSCEQDSLAMARLSRESGVSIVAATPHFGAFSLPEAFSDIRRSFDRLSRLLTLEHSSLTLCDGMELFAAEGVQKFLNDGLVIPLNGSRFLLTEFDFDADLQETEFFLDSICDAGYIPVIAHPERYSMVQNDPELPYRWCEDGYVLQLNKGSFFGLFGHAASVAARRMLMSGTLHTIASDAHSPIHRTPRLSDIRQYVSDNCFPELAELLLTRNPGWILSDRIPSPAYSIFPINGDRT